MNSNSLGARLRIARKGLEKSQDDMAAVCGVSREMWGKYERDAAMPGGEVLIKVALAGIDMNYILTGECAGGVKPAPTLTAEEETMLGYFRDASKEVRRAALGALLGASAPIGVAPSATPASKSKKTAASGTSMAARKRSSSTSTGEQVFHGQVGQALKVSGNLDQSGISFFSTKKGEK